MCYGVLRDIRSVLNKSGIYHLYGKISAKEKTNQKPNHIRQYNEIASKNHSMRKKTKQQQ